MSEFLSIFANDHIFYKDWLWGFIFSGMVRITKKSSFCLLTSSKFGHLVALHPLLPFFACFDNLMPWFDDFFLFGMKDLCKTNMFWENWDDDIFCLQIDEIFVNKQKQVTYSVLWRLHLSFQKKSFCQNH